MQDGLTKVFQKAKYKEDSLLAQNVWQAIVLHDKCIARVKLWAFSVVGFSSFIGLVPAFKILSTDLAQSGFYEYFSLAFSDGLSYLSYWKEFSFSLAESLPIMSITLSLSLVFILFLSLKYISKQIISNRSIGISYGVI